MIPHTQELIIGKVRMPLNRYGKVKIGHRANIRFANFPDSEYGIVIGIVKSISFVPTKSSQGEDYYTAEIE